MSCQICDTKKSIVLETSRMLSTMTMFQNLE